MDHEEAEAADVAAAAAVPMSASPPTFTLDGWGSAEAGQLLSLGYRYPPFLTLLPPPTRHPLNVL
jgi:hypothetical protein